MVRQKFFTIAPLSQLRTDLQEIEIELEKYRQILAASPDPIIITDSNYKIAYTNPAFKHVLGYDSELVLGKNPRFIFADRNSRKMLRSIVTALKTGKSITTEDALFLKKNGSPIYAHATFFPVIHNKIHMFYVLIFHDISAQVLLTKQNQQLSNQNKLILESAGEGIYGIDLEGVTTFINPTAARLLGYTSQEVLGKNIHNLVHYKTPDENPLPIEKCEHFTCALRRGTQFHSSEYVFWKKNGSPLPIEINSTPMYENGKIIGAVALFSDISQRIKTDELKTQFLSMMSHELKTPLSTVMLLSDMLIKKSSPHSKTYKPLTTIYHELKRLNSLINELLDISRLDTDKFSIKVEPIRLRAFTKRIIESVVLVNPKRTIELKNFPAIVVKADPNRLEQVFINLLNNAIKYSAAHTQITISATVKRKKAIVEIRDQGIGIPKNKIEQIFDRYYQIEGSERYNGIGLGLYISKEIIQKHKGKIWVESEAGKGSSFFFTLPITDKESNKTNKSSKALDF